MPSFGGPTPRTAAALALVALAAPAAARGDLAAGEVLSRVQRWLDGTRDLEARFEQSLISGALGAGATEAGRMFLARPGRMRWDYADPERKVALVDGTRTWLFLAEEEQLILGRLDEESELLTVLLAGSRPLGELFDVERVATPGDGGAGTYHLRLVPHEAADTFRQVLIAVRPPEFAIEGVEVLDAAGNRILYRFADRRRNRGLPEALFGFEAPEGTEVVGAH